MLNHQLKNLFLFISSSWFIMVTETWGYSSSKFYIFQPHHQIISNCFTFFLWNWSTISSSCFTFLFFRLLGCIIKLYRLHNFIKLSACKRSTLFLRSCAFSHLVTFRVNRYLSSPYYALLFHFVHYFWKVFCILAGNKQCLMRWLAYALELGIFTSR